MKSIFKKVSVLIGAVLVTLSCDEQLDIDPIGFLSDANTFETVDNLQQGLNGAYGRVATQQNNIVFDIITDEVKVGLDSGGQRVNFYTFNLNNQSGEAAAHWTSNYGVINQVNRVLEASDPATNPALVVEDGEQAELNNIRGQLFALRAYSHWELLQWFATSYTDGSALAAPYVDFVVTIEELPRNTVSEMLTGINADIAQARSLLSSSNSVIEMNQDFLTALEARIALYTENFGVAQTKAQELINKYPLANRTQYEAMFNDEDNTEVIFKLERVTGDFPIGGVWVFTGSGNAFLEMSNGMYDALNPADIRYDVNFIEEDSDPANNLHYIGKYTGPGFLNDLKVARVSEMHLILAEAQARTGGLDDAAQTLKGIRDARFGLDTTVDSYANATEAVNAILDERRIELAYEGHRYLDIRRTRALTGTGIVRDTRDCPTGACNLLPDDFRFNLPIPLAELNANDNMVQNPGYGS